jgi:hypothetical protein
MHMGLGLELAANHPVCLIAAGGILRGRCLLLTAGQLLLASVAVVPVAVAICFLHGAGKHLLIAALSVAVSLLIGAADQLLRPSIALLSMMVGHDLLSGADELPTDRAVAALRVAVSLGGGNGGIAIRSVNMTAPLRHLANQKPLCIIAGIPVAVSIELCLSADQISLLVLTFLGMGMGNVQVLLTVQCHDQTGHSAIAFPNMDMLLQMTVGLHLGRHVG